MTFERLLRRPLAIALTALLALPFVPATANAQQTQSTQQQTTPVQQQGGAPSVPPPMPNPKSETQGPPVVTAPAPSEMQPAAPAPPPAQPAQTAQPPVGTATAPYEKGIGVAASRPAGVVIAPAKQRRSRSFLIKTGLIIGAAVAVGTVVALSNASPSQPH